MACEILGFRKLKKGIYFMCVYLGVIYIYNYFQFLAHFPKMKVGLLLSPESFHARSSRGVHPTVSDFNEIWYTASMDKYNNPYFLFSPYWLSFSFYSPLKITLNVGVLQIAAKQRNDTVCFN
jgi:hypothetical protein